MASTGLLSKADYEGYAEEGKGLAVPPPNIKVKDAVKFVAEMTPIIGDAIAAKEIKTNVNPKVNCIEPIKRTRVFFSTSENIAR